MIKYFIIILSLQLILVHVSFSQEPKLNQEEKRKLLNLLLIPEYLRTIFTNRSSSSIISFNGISGDCQDHFQQWVKDIRDNDAQPSNWALAMVDSWGRGPEGILSGNLNSMGDFDECLGANGGAFKGQYCTIHLFPAHINTSSSVSNNDNVAKGAGGRSIEELMDFIKKVSKSDHPVNPSFGSCFPSSCSKSEMQSLTEDIFINVEGLSGLLSPKVTICYQDKGGKGVDWGVISMTVILSIILLLCILGSALDISKIHNNNTTNSSWWKFLVCFSIPQNGSRLLSTKSGADSIGCIHGLRFLSACWIVMGHTFYMFQLIPTSNLLDLANGPKNNLLTLFMLNCSLSVDTFLTITGLLVAINLLKQLEANRDGGNGVWNPFRFYLQRYIRLTPMYALLIGISATLMPLFGNGPKWNVLDKWSQFCRRNWWHNLIYINNLDIYDPPGSDSDNMQCFGEAWYLAVDMQLFLISPLIIYPLWKWEKIGILFLCMISILSFIVPGIVTYTRKLAPASLPYRDLGAFTHESYMVPWMRASPYLIGIGVGYLLHKIRAHQGGQGGGLRMKKRLLLPLWLIFILMNLSLIFGIQKFFDWNYVIGDVEGAFYAGMNHGVWGLGVGFLILACSTGFGGWIGRFLQWKVFIPLGRLTYAIYLISLNLQFIMHFSLKTEAHFDVYTTVNIGLSHIVMSCFVSFIVSLTMESPFMELERIFLKGVDRKAVVVVEAEQRTIYGAQVIEVQ